MGQQLPHFSSNAQINTLVTNDGLLGVPASATNRYLPCRCVSDRGRVSKGPTTLEQKVNSDIGVFFQDTWDHHRFTLNYGGRFDHFKRSVPAQVAAGQERSRRATS